LSVVGLLAGCTPTTSTVSAHGTVRPTSVQGTPETAVPTATPTTTATKAPAHASAPVHRATVPKVVVPVKPAPKPPAPLSYRDSSYSESGAYVSPDGPETIDVHLTLAHDIVTAVSVAAGAANDAEAMNYENMFAEGISAVVVGKNIDSLHVGVVGGSSLTSQGFSAALAKIKNDAKI
jgi:hypothetical protein